MGGSTSIKRVQKKPRCFAIMPFAKPFDDISSIIKKAASTCGMTYVRGDLRKDPGSVLPQILKDIQEAAVVVVDVTDHNPNVFYELGIAHQLKGPDQVVIITQSTDKSPYDVHEYRQLPYEHTTRGRLKLGKQLPLAIQAALEFDPDHENWNVIRGRVQRTRVIVRDLRRLLGKNEQEKIGDIKKLPRLNGITIRCAAGLGSLAISEQEPPDPTEGPDYDLSLREERDLLRTVLLRGAKLKTLLSPPRVFARKMLPERLTARYKRLISLLRGRSTFSDKRIASMDLQAMKQCQWALNPVAMPNLFIIGKQVAYEGIKRGGSRGFERTHCEKAPEVISKLILEFDSHFDDCVKLHKPNNSLADVLQNYLDEALA